MRITVLLSLCCALACIEPVHAQPKPPTAQAAVRFGFEQVSGWLAASAELVPADKYGYKPVATVRSFGELMAHAADGMNWLCGSARAPKDVEWSDAIEKTARTKAAIVAALKKATAGCASAYSAPNARLEKLMENLAHSNLHYGNVITYMRMLGLKPPSS